MVLLIVPEILILTSVDINMAELNSVSERNNSWPLSTSSRLIEGCGTSEAANDGPEIKKAERESNTKTARPNLIAGHLFVFSLDCSTIDVDILVFFSSLVCPRFRGSL